jgi:26S proteasome regulatory subunit N9
MQPVWSQEPDLAAAYPALRQKIALLTVMEMVFQCAARDRGLAFADIAAQAQLPVDEVGVSINSACTPCKLKIMHVPDMYQELSRFQGL